MKSPKKDKSPEGKKEKPKAASEVNKKNLIQNIKDSEFFVPKNVNQYRHIIECYYSRESDLEWMLKLRRHKKIKNIQKEPTTNPPNFYNEDYEKYRTKTESDNNGRKKFLKTNIGTFNHVVKRPFLNGSIFSFETTLREEQKNKKVNIVPWRSLNYSSKRNLFDTYLPPVLTQSKDNLNKMKDLVSRPLIQVNSKTSVNGVDIRQRKFELSPDRTSRSPFEHVISNKYNDKYAIKNIGAIKHIMNFDNSNINTLWETKLREYDKKTIHTST